MELEENYCPCLNLGELFWVIVRCFSLNQENDPPLQLTTEEEYVNIISKKLLSGHYKIKNLIAICNFNIMLGLRVAPSLMTF